MNDKKVGAPIGNQNSTKPQEKKSLAYIHMRVPKKTKARLVSEARKHNMSLTKYILHRISEINR